MLHNVESIIKVLENETDILFAYLFGSYAKGTQDKKSDIDIAVYLKDEKILEKEGNKLKLTGLGRDIAEILEKNTSDEEKEMIEDFKSELNDLTEDELLGFIYFTFPEMTRESVKFEKIKPKRMNIALSLYAKSKISLGEALEIAGMNIDTFMKEAKLKGIQIYT